MSNRLLPNWLDAYMEYTEDTESSTLYHKWVGLSMIAAVLRKKTWFRFGRIRIYPNMYVVLVAEPGITRKTQAISFGTKLLKEIPDIETSADAITKEALIEDLESSATETTMEDGTSFRHASISIISREFESFLGQKKENTKMLVLLTDLFDCEEMPFRYRTKASGSNTVPSVFLNLLGATTPESLASSLPPTAIGGGLTSRIIFVWGEDKPKKVPIPEYSIRTLELKDALITDLNKIANIAGTYDFDNETRDFWIDWYNSYDERDPTRICKDPSFNGWYSRKPMYVIKMSMILTAATTNDRVVKVPVIEDAITRLEEIELLMGNTFGAVGRSSLTADINTVRQKIEQAGCISHSKLLQMVWRDVDDTKLEEVVKNLKKSGLIEKDTSNPTNVKYWWGRKPKGE
jgi:hypothetical protein